jgi:endonuclease YncB( thermonuclease family)
MTLRLLVLLGLFGLFALAPPIGAQSNPVLVGRVIKVTDGDTIKVQLASGPINVRFDSMDAPESNQPHGAASKAALARLVANRQVELDVVSQDRYERLVATVYVGDLNVNERMVKDGHAWAYREYLKDRDYCRWEDQARRQKRGLWALAPSSWIYPSDWRRLRRGRTDTVRDFSRETVERCIASIGED